MPDTVAANVPPAAINPADWLSVPVLYSVRLPAAAIVPPLCARPFVAVATPLARPAFEPVPIRRSPSDDSTPPDCTKLAGVTVTPAPVPVALIVPPDWLNAPPVIAIEPVNPDDTTDPAGKLCSLAPAMIAPADSVTPPVPDIDTTGAFTTPADCTYVPPALRPSV